MVAAHNIQQSNTRRGGRGGNGLAFVEQRVGASTMRRALPMSFPPTLTTKAPPSIAASLGHGTLVGLVVGMTCLLDCD